MESQVVVKDERREGEYRESWDCSCVLHGGDGPEVAWPCEVLACHPPMTPGQAAEEYARGHMDSTWGDGSTMYVAVEMSTKRWNVYACTKRLVVKIERSNNIEERTDLITK